LAVKTSTGEISITVPALIFLEQKTPRFPFTDGAMKRTGKILITNLS
jgi:hypothetical protein